MSIDAYILVDFPNGSVALTTKTSPQEKNFDGQSRFYLPNISELTLPSRNLDPLGGSSSDASCSVGFFKDDFMPGITLSNRMPLQNSPLKIWLENSDGQDQVIFDGVVGSVEYTNEMTGIKVNGVRKSVVLANKFPPGRILDEGRFIKRLYFERYVDGERLTQIILVPSGMEFKSVFGTPSSPSSVDDPAATVVYQGVEWNYAPGAIQTIPEAKIHFSENQGNYPVPVMYGYHPQPVPLTVAFHYRVVQIIGGNPDYFKVFVALLGNHTILGDELSSNAPYDIGQDYNVRIFHNDELLTYGYGFTQADDAGSTVSYVTFRIEYDGNWEKPIGIDSFSDTGLYTKNIRGKQKPGGGLLNSLGDALTDLWQSYGGGSTELVDWDLVERSTQELNAFEMAMLVNAGETDQTLEQVILNRISGQFPVALGYPRGKLAWESLVVGDRPVTRKIEFGRELVSRTGIGETSISNIINDMTVSFGINGASDSETESIHFNKDNLEICRASHERWGDRPRSAISVSDTTSPATASLIAQQKLALQAGVRVQVQYETFDLSFLTDPLFGIYEITDESAGFDSERFIFHGVQWNGSFTALVLSFLSDKMV